MESVCNVIGVCVGVTVFLSMLFGIFRCVYCTFIVFYSVYCVLLPYGVINDDSEVYAVCYRPSVRPAPA